MGNVRLNGNPFDWSLGLRFSMRGSLLRITDERLGSLTILTSSCVEALSDAEGSIALDMLACGASPAAHEGSRFPAQRVLSEVLNFAGVPEAICPSSIGTPIAQVQTRSSHGMTARREVIGRGEPLPHFYAMACQPGSVSTLHIHT
jgi:hypothetical protein